jgi:molybdopterin-guanine dinucleotide biosynthesis protein B
MTARNPTAHEGPRVIGIAGWKNAGKTTLASRLIAAFVARSLRVASVKHSHHGIQVDDGDSDSARHRRAGAQQVAVIAPGSWAVIRALPDASEPSLEAMLAKLDPCDVVVVEGYKRAPIAKIEVRRAAGATGDALADADPHVIAIAADHAVANARVPVFDLDDVEAIADFVLSRPRS